jgi:hypothetical protein
MSYSLSSKDIIQSPISRELVQVSADRGDRSSECPATQPSSQPKRSEATSADGGYTWSTGLGFECTWIEPRYQKIINSWPEDRDHMI